MTITVTLPSGETADVEPSALSLPEGAQIVGPDETPHGFVRESFMQAEMKRRSGDAKALRRQLADDPEFRASILADAGVKVGDDGKAQIPDVSEAVKTARAKWETEQLEPVRGSLDKLQQSLAREALLSAAKDKVRPEFAARIGEAPSYVETALGSRVKYDPELGYVVALGPDGNPLPSASGERPYADASEFVDSFLASEAGAILRREERNQTGGGFRGTGDGSHGAKTLTRAAVDAMDPAAKAAFFRSGGTATD